MRLSQSSWEKLLFRWAGAPDSGEVRLLCAVLADGIVTKSKDKFFYSDGFNLYCKAIGLDVDFVRQQVGRADNYIAAPYLFEHSNAAS